MPQTVRENVTDMLIRQAVVDDPARLAPGHHAMAAEQAQLVAERRLAQAKQKSHVANAQLLGEREGVQDPGPGRIGEDREGRGHLIGDRVIDHSPEQWGDVLGMKALCIAPLRGQVDI